MKKAAADLVWTEAVMAEHGTEVRLEWDGYGEECVLGTGERYTLIDGERPAA